MGAKLLGLTVGLMLSCANVSAVAEVWKCDLISNSGASQQHTFTRAGSDTYVHTTDNTYFLSASPETVTETKIFQIAAQTEFRISLIYSEGFNDPSYATLFMVAQPSPTAMLSRHNGFERLMTGETGVCKVACTNEDRKRILPAKKICAS